jgi:hypothetical protein
MANQRGQVLGTIQDWLRMGGGAQDVLDDAQLYSAIELFLIAQWTMPFLSLPILQIQWFTRLWMGCGARGRCLILSSSVDKMSVGWSSFSLVAEEERLYEPYGWDWSSKQSYQLQFTLLTCDPDFLCFPIL